MLAFHNNPGIKDMYLKRVHAHRVADEIRQGYAYWQDGKGCAVGCTIHGSDHATYETELGIPQVIAHLEDRIFEDLSDNRAKEWPELFLSAIRPGADLSRVCPQFLAWLLADPTEGVIRFANTETTREIILRVATLHREGCTDAEKWSAAAGAARAAVYAEAYANAARAAADAARAAANAGYAANTWDAAHATVYARVAAERAAKTAAAVADADAAREAAVVRQSEKLLELLRAA